MTVYTFYGTSGNNLMNGTSGDDDMFGGAGNDTMSSGSGQDLIYGGTGNDVISYGEGLDTVFGGDGDDVIDDAPGANATATGSVLFGDAGSDLVLGSAGHDTVDGGTGTDRLFGENGNDAVFGAAGADYAQGDDGNDWVQGGAGADTLFGGAGNDTVWGDDAAANNLIVNGSFEAGLAANDIQYNQQSGWRSAAGFFETWGTGALGRVAADGQNFIEVDIDGTVDRIWQDVKTDAGQWYTLTFQAMQRDGATADTLIVEFGGCQVACVVPSAAGWQTYTITVQGSGGLDRLAFAESGTQNNTMGVLLDNVRLVSATTGLAEGDSLSGGDGSDVIYGEAGNDTVAGDAGNDRLFGGTGNDALSGGAGADSVQGDDGDDSIQGNAGADTLAGGAGNDTIWGDQGTGPNLIVNGGFESGLAPGNIQYNQQTGWTSAAGFMETWASGALGRAAVEGNNFIEVDVDGTVDRIWQDVKTDAGQTYTLTFQAQQRDGATTDALVVQWNGVEVANVVPGSAGWQTFTITVTGTGGFDRLTFGESAAQNNTMGVLLDNVRLVATSTQTGEGDLISGGDGDDLINGDGGNDTLAGDAGNDRLFGGTGHDALNGGLGNDVLSGGDGNDTLLADAGDDSLTGGAGNDSLSGGAGNDTLAMGAGDVADGGAGNDRFTIDPALVAGGAATIIGGLGADTLDLTTVSGASVTYLAGSTTDGTGQYTNAAGATVTFTFSGIETVLLANLPVNGTAGDDLIGAGYVDAANSQIDGTDGVNDTVYGLAGNDTINAGLGHDVIYGGDGDDTFVLTGVFGNDTIFGGAAAEVTGDTLDATAVGAAAVNLATGTLVAAGGSVSFTGIETVLLGAGGDTVTGSAGLDIVYANGGDDQVNTGVGTDVVYGGDGNDYIVATSIGFGTVDEGISSVLDPDLDIFNDIDEVYGGAGQDTILTGDDQDFVNGGAGHDSIDAGIDADVALGEDGNDTLIGGEGRDGLYGGDGNDLLYGGAADGNDPYAADDLTDIAPDNDDDILFGGAGDDTIYGGDDTDVMLGGDGNDLLFGGLDADVLSGGAGNNTLTGGAGADEFVFTPGEVLEITDFGTASGAIDDFDPSNNDFIDLSAYYTSLAEAVADFDDDALLNQSIGDFTDNVSMLGGSIRLVGVTATALTYDTTLLV